MGSKKKRRTFTAAFKAEVVQQVRASGKKPAEVARELGLSESSVRGWLRQAEREGASPAPLSTPPPAPPPALPPAPAPATISAQKAPARAVKRRDPEPPAEPMVEVETPRPLLAEAPSEAFESAPPLPDLGETTAPLSAFRLVEARATLPRMAARPARPDVPAPPAPAPRRFALLAGAAAPLLVVGALFLARPAEGGAEMPTTDTRAVVAPPVVAPPVVAPPVVASTTPAPVPSLEPAPAPPPTPAASVAPATLGTIVTATTSHDHRIFIDGRTVGETGQAIEVRCGHHQARYGSQGRWQTIDVPCGGQYTLVPSW